MNIRAQEAMVFHLDKCIGCHTCSLACKNIWTDRRGTGIHVVEQRRNEAGDRLPDALRGPGSSTGAGGSAASADRGSAWAAGAGRPGRHLFQPPPAGSRRLLRALAIGMSDLSALQQARPARCPPRIADHGKEHRHRGRARIGMTTSSGSPIYAAQDPNLRDLGEGESSCSFRATAPGLLLSSRASAITASTRRAWRPAPPARSSSAGEDGIVLVNQAKCRGWRMCVSGCPYKKVYFNWAHRKVREVHPLLSPPRDRTGPGLHACVRGPDPVLGDAPLRCR